MFGALLFLLLATLILETSGSEIILFLSQNEDSVNTKCKVELREVLQRVVSLHWNKCWFVQKKKKSMPFLDLVSPDFLFPFFAKEMCASWLQQSAHPAVRHYGKAAPMGAPSRCWTCCRCARGWAGTCAGHKLEARERVNEIKSAQILCLASSSAVWSNCLISELFHALLFRKSLF